MGYYGQPKPIDRMFTLWTIAAYNRWGIFYCGIHTRKCIASRKRLSEIYAKIRSGKYVIS